MAAQAERVASQGGTSLADVLERVLDKGVVIAGDVRLLLCGVEVLTIQLRLVVCSVDKAVEIGLDWWNRPPSQIEGDRRVLLPSVEERLARLERAIEGVAPPPPAG